MQAGELDQRIAVLAPNASREGMGETVEDYVLLRKVWARQIEGVGREFIASGQIANEKRVVFKMRFARDIYEIGARLRIGWAGRLFEVVDMTGTYRSGELFAHCQSIGVYP